MIPTFEPDARLAEAIRSVLVQRPPGDAMHIAVVDDGSKATDVRALVRAADPSGRVEVFVHAERLGLAGNWNRAISLARGKLVHLLHQDDYVVPGFYERMRLAFERAPGIGMAFCRNHIVDATGNRLKTSSRIRWFPGVIDNWPWTIATRQRIQTPSVVVARTTYDAVGRYRDDLCHTLDWEMWVRIAARCAVWYEPRPLAVYRRHPRNESSRLVAAGALWPDIIRAISINSEAFPADVRPRIVRRSARWHFGSMMRTAIRQVREGNVEKARDTLEHLPSMLPLFADERHACEIGRRLVQLRRRLDAIPHAA